MGVYDFPEHVDYKGKKYLVLRIIDNEFIMVIRKEEVESEQFPAKPLVIPREF